MDATLPTDKLAQVKAEIELIEAERALAIIKRKSIPESAFPEFVDPYEYLRDDGFWFPIGGQRPDLRGDREKGMDVPLFRSEQELAYFRSIGRTLCRESLPAINAVKTLTNYTIGTGFKFSAQPAQTFADDEQAKKLSSWVQKCLDTFLHDNKFLGDMDRELSTRERRDGEWFLHLDRDGAKTQARIIEPSCVTEPEKANELCNHYGDCCGSPCNWSFGIHTLNRDPTKPLGYHVVYDGVGNDWEYLPANEVVHGKARTVDRNVKRAVSEFYPADKDLRNAHKLLSNMVGGATIQAAIALLRKHSGNATQAQVESLRSSSAYATYNQPLPGGGTRQKHVQKFDLGTVIDHGNIEYQAGPLGAGQAAEGFVSVLQAGLRYVGILWSMPEYMMTSDASNGTYASLLAADTPFVKARESDQQYAVSQFTDIAWKVIRNAFDGGYFSPLGLSWEQIEHLIELKLGPPRVSSRDIQAETASDGVLVDRRIMSRRTAASRNNLDYDQEKANIEKEDEDPLNQAGGLMGGFSQNQDPDDDSQDSDEYDVAESYDESKHPRDHGKFATKAARRKARLEDKATRAGEIAAHHEGLASEHEKNNRPNRAKKRRQFAAKWRDRAEKLMMRSQVKESAVYLAAAQLLWEGYP